jgi:hypothetical protein
MFGCSCVESEDSLIPSGLITMKDEEDEEKKKSYRNALEHLQKLREDMYLDVEKRTQRLEDLVDKMGENLEQQQYFTRGIALGLLYGIIGNIVVSHYYGVFEGLGANRFDSLFWSNLVVLLVSLVLIVALTVLWISRLKRLGLSQNKVALMKEVIEEMRKIPEDAKRENRET